MNQLREDFFQILQALAQNGKSFSFQTVTTPNTFYRETTLLGNVSTITTVFPYSESWDIRFFSCSMFEEKNRLVITDFSNQHEPQILSLSSFCQKQKIEQQRELELKGIWKICSILSSKGNIVSGTINGGSTCYKTSVISVNSNFSIELNQNNTYKKVVVTKQKKTHREERFYNENDIEAIINFWKN